MRRDGRDNRVGHEIYADAEERSRKERDKDRPKTKTLADDRSSTQPKREREGGIEETLD